MENYAIVEVGGKQYMLKKGTVVRTELLVGAEKGKTITLDKVLLISDGKDIKIGNPFIKNAAVHCQVNTFLKEKKILIHKYRRRNNSQMSRGHRQNKVELTVQDIKG